MTNIIVGRYGKDEGTVLEDGSVKQTWQGWIEDEAKTWIAFIDAEGRPVFFLHRDDTGGVIDGPPTVSTGPSLDTSSPKSTNVP